MRQLYTSVITLLFLTAFISACSTAPRQPDQDQLDRRDDAMEELERQTR